MLLVLTGCVQIDKATGKPIGPVWDFLGAPMGELSSTSLLIKV